MTSRVGVREAPVVSPQELVRLCGAQERELRRARQRGELPGARGGPLPSLPARLPATSDVSIVHRDGVSSRL